MLADLVLDEGPLSDSQMTVFSLCAHLTASLCTHTQRERERERETDRQTDRQIDRLTERGEGFPESSVGKESPSNARDPGSIPGSGGYAGEGIGYPLQYSWAPLVAQLVKNLLAVWETWVRSWVRKVPWRREQLPTPVFWPGDVHGLYSP